MEGPIKSESVTLDATGRGVVSLGPLVVGDNWRISRMVTSITGSTTNTRLHVYRYAESPSNLIDGTYTAEQNVSEIPDGLLVRNGERLVFVWSDGTPGAIASIILTGESGRGVQ